MQIDCIVISCPLFKLPLSLRPCVAQKRKMVLWAMSYILWLLLLEKAGSTEFMHSHKPSGASKLFHQTHAFCLYYIFPEQRYPNIQREMTSEWSLIPLIATFYVLPAFPLPRMTSKDPRIAFKAHVICPWFTVSFLSLSICGNSEPCVSPWLYPLPLCLCKYYSKYYSSP